MNAPGADAELFVRAASGEREALDEAVARHAGLVHHVARRFLGRATGTAGRAGGAGEGSGGGAGPGAEDLVQAGFVGLISAIVRFDPTRGTPFSSFAMPFILGEMRACLEAERGGPHLGRRARRRLQEARAAEQRLSQELGRTPTVPELAAAVGTDPSDLAALLEAAAPQRAVEGDGRAPAVASFEDERLDAASLRAVLRALPERERRILILRHVAGLSQAETGLRVGLSQAQVSRLERRALDLARSLLLAREA